MPRAGRPVVESVAMSAPTPATRSSAPRGRPPPARRPDARRRRPANRRTQRHDDPVEEQNGIGTDARRECVHDKIRPKHTATMSVSSVAAPQAIRRHRPYDSASRQYSSSTIPRRSRSAPASRATRAFQLESSRAYCSRWHENTSNTPCTVEHETVETVARRTGSFRFEPDGEESMPTTSSLPRGSIATSPRARHRTRTGAERPGPKNRHGPGRSN